MADNDQSDPFLWDEDRVVIELCSENKSWNAPPARRLPDPQALEARLRECGVDGESLLTYGDEFDLDKLWSYLGVKKLPHQLSLKDAISQFQKRSKRYQEWKAQKLADSQLYADDNEGRNLKEESNPPPDSVQAAPTPAAVSEAVAGPGAGLPDLTGSGPGVLSPAPSALIDQDSVIAAGVPEIPGPAIDEGSVEEPPAKKRRIAPTAVSAIPTGAYAFIPTEGDIFMRGTAESLLQVDDESGYLGRDTLVRDQLTRHAPLDESSDEETGFVVVQKRIPPGRRLQVSSAMKRFLRSGRSAQRKADDEQSQDSLDPVLPVFGESDDEVDSATWREFQEEEKERAAREAREAASKDRSLSKEEVKEVVQNAIEQLEAQWEAEKRPKHDLDAWKTWQAARRSPNRLALIENARNMTQQYTNQIAKFSKNIINMRWTVSDDLPRKTTSWLEKSVFNRKYQAWYIDVVRSPRQPPKPETLPPLPKPEKPKPHVVDDDNDSEVLTSDSDDLDAFIEYDEDEQVLDPLGDEMDLDVELPQENDSAESPPSGSPRNQDHESPVVDPTQGQSEDEEPDMSLPEPSATPVKIKVEKAVPATPRPVGKSSQQPIMIGSSPTPCDCDESQATGGGLPGFDDLESLRKIADFGVEHWQEAKDGERLLVAVLCGMPRDKLADLHGAIRHRDHKALWATYIEPIVGGAKPALDSIDYIICRLFVIFFGKSTKRMGKPLQDITVQRIKREGDWFRAFCTHLKRVVPLLLDVPLTPGTRVVLKTPRKEPLSTQRSRNVEDATDDPNLEELSDDVPTPSTKKRRRKKRHDQKAADLRKDITDFNKELERRRRQLQEKLASQGTVSSKQARLIVNESKESDEQAFIYINDHIGAKIKDHQIDGVRFMWNQVVVHSKVRQGCLLAHTMGLGKTMQVITLLVVIAESSDSSDESIRSQIPENLREGKTLILCPPSLIDNWDEEIRTWAPGGILGPVYRLDGIGMMSRAKRLATIKAWAAGRGVLIVGYALFTTLVRGDDEVAKLLQETPGLVVGDEAHYMKNPDSQRHQATANFKTMNRIAMTGSPLTNNVMDYYAMINWVAPGYLADIAEFRDKYANPIKEGLYIDSDPSQKGLARRKLHALKAIVEPKVHRRDIEVLLHELPRKQEFIITLPLTKVQDKLYRTYVEWAINPGMDITMGRAAQARAWSLVAKLGLVLAHPRVFKRVAEMQKNRLGKKPVVPSKSPSTSDSDNDVEIPQDALSALLAATSVKNIESYELSNKIIVLLRILEECKKVGDKVLVFSQSIPSLDYIAEICKRQKVVYKRLDGATPISTRQHSVKNFNTDVESEVYLISTRTGGVGLNIYGANRVVIFDFRYTPAEEQQAIGRAYRLGQTKPVYVYWLTVGGTFEDTIHNNAIFKTQLASRVVDKKNPDPWATRFSEYFSMPREVEQEDLSGARGQDRVLDAILDSPDVGKLIRKITSTETFEREEIYELTPEEQQEAEKDIEMERLRFENPEEYRRRERERAAVQAAIHAANMTPVTPVPLPSYIRTPTTVAKIDAEWSSKSPNICEITTGQFRRHRQLFDLFCALDGIAPPNVPTTPQTVPPQTQKGADGTPGDAAPQPILATGSAFKITPALSPAMLSSPTPKAGEDKNLEPSLELLNVHRTLCEEGRHVRYHPAELMNRVNTVLTRDKIETLPLLDKLQNLRRFSRDSRFAEAMLSGYMEPEQLASLSRAEMERISRSLNQLEEAEFKHKVWTTKAEINRLRQSATTPSTPGVGIKIEKTTGPTKGGTAARDKGGGHKVVGTLRFIGTGPDSQEPVTPADRQGAALRPGDSPDLPHVID
ncbi:hypothetical protein VTJ49DRAFT_4344 [Mycothermus thermophilus]|uniref:Uncharacterized protein n=1 Tax=Humicola insolens TaxID=85995 RepID=A0ABR3V7H5_HUMIN